MTRLKVGLAALLLLALGAGIPLAAQQSNVTNAVVIAALQAMGLFGDGYADGECSGWSTADQMFVPSACSGGSAAPNDATYITQTPNASLTSEQALSALASGILRVQTATGVVTALTDSAGIAANISDETGTGALVFATGPVITLANGTGLPISTGVSGLGTGVAAALAVNTGSAGAVVLFNDALGTPSSGTLTNATGLPISTGVSGLGANVATFLATPSSANLAAALTDETGSGLAVFGTAPSFLTTTTLTRDALATTSTDGVVVTNTTAATGGATVQISPRLRLTGAAWDSDTSVSRTTSWLLENLPTSGTSDVGVGFLKFGFITASGSIAYPMQLTYNVTSQLQMNPDTNNCSQPQFSFQSDNDNGMAYVSANTIGIGTQGTCRITLSPTLITFALPLVFTSLADSLTAPTIASGGCTTPAVTHNNGTLSFLITIGTSCTGVKTFTLTMPAAAHFWACDGENNTSDAQQQTNYIVARATSTTAVVFTSYDRVTGVQEDFTASDTYLIKCRGE